MLLILWGLGLIAAFFISHVAFKRVWKGNVTMLKLAGFTFTFALFFALISYIITLFFVRNFGR